MVAPPQVPIEFTQLPEDLEARHEALVDAFGYMLFSMRNQSIRHVTHLVSSENGLEELGSLFRQAYEEAAKLSPNEQKIALDLAAKSIDFFAHLILTMLAGSGTEQTLGTKHAICFRLQMEIKEIESGNIVDEETINRNGKKFFPEYWGRWLNRFGKV